MNADDDFAYQASLIARSTEKIEMNYLRAVRRGAVEPMVLLVDLRDDRARAILEPFGRADRVDRMIAEAADREELPAVFAGLPRRVVLEVTEGVVPGLEATLGSMEAGEGYLVLVLARGGALAVARPRP